MTSKRLKNEIEENRKFLQEQAYYHWLSVMKLLEFLESEEQISPRTYAAATEHMDKIKYLVDGED